jgi:hypothetical protein
LGLLLLAWVLPLAFVLGSEAFCLWLLPFNYGFLVWEAFGREKNY